MKLFTRISILALVTPAAVAFTAQQQQQQPPPQSTRMTTSLDASRRECLNFAAAAAAVAALPQVARADLDFERVQDLLKDAPQGQDYAPSSGATTPGGRPKWLTEPTDEFKENERKSMDFKREQLQLKQKATQLLEKLQDEPNNEDAIAGDLDALRLLVRSNGGLPLGITKDDVIKQVRRKKAKKYWPVNVEIAYQDLLSEIAYQQSPNTDQSGEKKYL